MERGAVILCGGQSTRMGRDKATLPFGPREVMLQRVVRIVSEVVEPSRIVVVAAEGQELPALPRKLTVARDQRPERGPLEGLAAGLSAITGRADIVYATSCDVPLMVPAFIKRLFDLISGSSQSENCNLKSEMEIVVPRDGKFHHPLAAVYRTSVLPAIEALLAADRLRPVFLFEECRTLEVAVDKLRDIDPELHSLMNCNRPEDYEASLKLAGLA
jgi:molybdenum cofactor guanylyltransferase